MTPEEIKNLVATIIQSSKTAEVLLELSEALKYDAVITQTMVAEEMPEDDVADPTPYAEDLAISKKLEEAANLLQRASELISSLDTDADEAQDENTSVEEQDYIAQLVNDEMESGRWDDWSWVIK